MRREIALWLVLAGIAVATPHVLPTYYSTLLVQILVFGLLATSLDMMVAYLGLASLGHAVFFGVAGYVAGGFLLWGVTDVWLNLFISLAATLLLAFAYSFTIRNARGGNFLMISLALNQVCWALAYGMISVTGGEYGLADLPRPTLIGDLSLRDPDVLYYFVIGWCLLGILIVRIVLRSPFGLALRGFKANEERMASLGYSDFVYRSATTCISGVVAGLAGVLWAYYNAFVSPANLSLEVSANALFMAMLGGSGYMFGPLLGSAVLLGAETIVSSYTEHWQFYLGLIYILVALMKPSGLVAGFTRTAPAKGTR